MARRLTIIEGYRGWYCRRFAIVLAVATGGGALIALCIPNAWFPSHWVFAVVNMGLCVAGIVRSQNAKDRAAAAMRACDWSRCLYRFFDLRGLEPHGHCPECGEAYDIDHVRTEWRKWPWVVTAAVRRYRV